MKCFKCGVELTDEMFAANMCFNCGSPTADSQKAYELEQEKCRKENDILRKKAEAEKLRLEQERIAEQDTRLKNHLLSTGFCFDGFRIEKYLGLVSGETVIGTGYFSDLSASISDLFGASVPEYSEKMKAAKRAAIADMIKDSVALGGNAIISISFEFMTFSRDIIGVSVNGTSVFAKKSEDE